MFHSTQFAHMVQLFRPRLLWDYTAYNEQNSLKNSYILRVTWFPEYPRWDEAVSLQLETSIIPSKCSSPPASQGEGVRSLLLFAM